MAQKNDLGQQESLQFSPDYTTPYNKIVREHVVMGVPRYFLLRWLPILGTDVATLVNSLRQITYRNQNDTIAISGAALAKEAAMSRRHLYTCLDHTWISAFITQHSGQKVRTTGGTITQQTNRYTVRMDDPLTPPDAEHLLITLQKLADNPVLAAQKAVEIEPKDLWGPDIKASSAIFATPGSITAHEVLRKAFPTWKASTSEEHLEFQQHAERLHHHVTLIQASGRASKIIVPQYFRRRWWPHLGHDLAWIYLYLRSCVYVDTVANEERDTCWIPTLSTLLDLIGRPREWWRRNVEKNSERSDWSLTDFFQQLTSEKGRDPQNAQWVARQFRVAIQIPIAPEDRKLYTSLLSEWSDSSIQVLASTPPAASSATSEHTGEHGLCHAATHRPPQALPHPSTPAYTGSATFELTQPDEVCHIQTHGSATLEHRKNKNKEQASQELLEYHPNSKHPGTLEPGQTEIDHLNNDDAAAEKHTHGKDNFIEELARTLKTNPQTPLYAGVPLLSWLENAWSEPIRPHTPVWNMAFSGQIAQQDLIAVMLAVWGDRSIQQPPRYLSWLLSRWQANPSVPPVDQWESWRNLAGMSLANWLGPGRKLWYSMFPSEYRPLPFGLDTLLTESHVANAGDRNDSVRLPGNQLLPEKEPVIRYGPAPDPFEGVGLDERPGSGWFSVRDIWLAILSQLEVQLNPLTYATWVGGTQAVSYIDGVLTVRARHALARDWLIKRLSSPIEYTASRLAQTPIKIRYTAADSSL